MSASPIQLKKLWWLGPLTVLAAILGVLIVRSIARMLLPPPYAPGLAMIMIPVVLTFVLCTAAVLVFALVVRFARHPVPTFIIISGVFLFISFLPDIAAASMPMPGAAWPYALTLMVMHVVAGLITVLMLTGSAAAEKA
ncbi:MAG TPA: DUF6069 family protein [Anaerolineales bacterium]|nr:DUF6069 family protein [Anaerolineales bacterium]